MAPAPRRCCRRDSCCSHFWTASGAETATGAATAFDFVGCSLPPALTPGLHVCTLWVCFWPGCSVVPPSWPPCPFPTAERRGPPMVPSGASCSSHHCAIPTHSCDCLLCTLLLGPLHSWPVKNPIPSQFYCCHLSIHFSSVSAFLKFSCHLGSRVSGKGKSEHSPQPIPWASSTSYSPSPWHQGPPSPASCLLSTLFIVPPWVTVHALMMPDASRSTEQTARFLPPSKSLPSCVHSGCPPCRHHLREALVGSRLSWQPLRWFPTGPHLLLGLQLWPI